MRNILTLNRTIYRLKVPSKKKALELMAEAFAAQEESFQPLEIFDRLVGRERIGSTALGQGVAIPHARIPEVTQSMGCLMLLSKGVDFEAQDKIAVDLIYGFIVPLEPKPQDLKMLADLAKLFSDESFRDKLRSASSHRELYERFIHP